MGQQNTSASIAGLQQALSQREDEVELLQQTLNEVLTDLDLDTVLDKVSIRARNLVRADTLLIPLLDESSETYTYIAGSGTHAGEIVGETLPVDYGVCGWVLRNRRPWWQGVLEELDADERNQWEKKAGTLILVPLQGKQRILGGITAINKQGSGDFTRRDFNLLTMFAGIVSIAIENAMTVQRMEEASELNEEYRRRLSNLNKQLIESTKELEFHALYDPLTQLPNRSLFRDRLGQAIGAKETKNQVAVLLIDFIRFRQINDAIGHDNGDLLLKKISREFTAVLEQGETLARMSGDEFAVILPGADLLAATRKAEAMQVVLASGYNIDNTEIVVTCSIGIVTCPAHGESVSDLLTHADVALSVAKNNRVSIYHYDPMQVCSLLSHVAMATDLQNALANEDFELYLQPQIEIRSGAVTAAEALGRWVHPRLGEIRPDVFVHELEQMGLMDRYTQWAIRSALDKALRLSRNGYDIKVSVNISVSNLLNPNFIAQLQSIVGDRSRGEHLCFEITENLFLSEYDRFFEVLEYICYLGITLSIDDFGTGYSSLSRLKSLPVSELKIDKSFVLDMNRYQNDEMIVRSTIDLAHNMGLRVVAEGVQDAATLRQLKSLGCDIVQGYFFGRPMAIDEFERYLSQARKHSA